MYTMERIRLSSFFLCGVLLCCAPEAIAASILKVSLSSVCSTGTTVRVRVSNSGPQDVTVPEVSLPWKSTSNALNFRAFLVSNDEMQKASIGGLVGDYFGEVVVKKGGYIEGEIDFTYVVKDIEQLRRRGAIIVRFHVPNGGRYKGGAGYVFIPRSQWFGTQCTQVLQGV